MHVFRLVQSGRVDKVIAFDSLPNRLLQGVEMRSPDGLPRHWKSFLGENERYTPPSAEKNPATGKVEMIGERREKGAFFYILNYKEINSDIERWQEISSFVRRAVNLKFRLLDKIEDMALPMSTDANSELKLEPEQLEENGAIIPIPEEFQEKGPAILDKNGNEVRPELPAGDKPLFSCEECQKPFQSEQALRMHSYRKHPKEKKEPIAVS